MYEFQSYDPSRPRMVTSFKGNQKLIFDGYRYNIHHVVSSRGVKTWRCVCAKKLTSARSWCKGRAETWDNDNQGISKGEHNHPAEHEIAELEYFKSQLILAAIDNPNAPLNELIDEAATYMSDGVSFSSRESLKKSLTVARKSAENGGFKLKNYKSSETGGAASKAANANINNNNGTIASQNTAPQPTQQRSGGLNSTGMKFPEKLRDLVFPTGGDSKFGMADHNGTMMSLLSLVQQQQNQQQSRQQLNTPIEKNNNNAKTAGNGNNNNSAANAIAALFFNSTSGNGGSASPSDSNADDQANNNCLPAATTAFLNQFAIGGQTNSNTFPSATSPFNNASSNVLVNSTADFLLNTNSGFDFLSHTSASPPRGKMARYDNAAARVNGGGSPASSSFNDSGVGLTPTPRRRKNASSTFEYHPSGIPLYTAAAASASGNRPNSSGSLNINNGANNSLSAIGNMAAGGTVHNLIQQQQKKKAARANTILDMLSNKAAAKASSGSSFTSQLPFTKNENIGGRASLRDSPFSTASSVDAISAPDEVSRHTFNGTPTPKPQTASVEVQTDDIDYFTPPYWTGVAMNGGGDVKRTGFRRGAKEENDGSGAIRLSACLGRLGGEPAGSAKCCECRVIKVCCCSEDTCMRQKYSTRVAPTSFSPTANSTDDTASEGGCIAVVAADVGEAECADKISDEAIDNDDGEDEEDNEEGEDDVAKRRDDDGVTESGVSKISGIEEEEEVVEEEEEVSAADESDYGGAKESSPVKSEDDEEL